VVVQFLGLHKKKQRKKLQNNHIIVLYIRIGNTYNQQKWKRNKPKNIKEINQMAQIIQA
jgi:hypothetical protein